MEIKLKFDGASADDHQLDFYDAAQAMIGFQRSLALTTHLVVNGKIITQAPALKGAKIFVEPPKAGSFEVLATLVVVGGALYKLGTAPKDTPIGHLVFSVYDFAIKRLCGVNVDYEKSISQQVDEINQTQQDGGEPLLLLGEQRIDSLLEKIEPAVRDMHRPIVKSRTADHGIISFSDYAGRTFGTDINRETFDNIISLNGDGPSEFVVGNISSYNVNTFKGRVYSSNERRPIPFELMDVARGPEDVSIVTSSLRSNARNRLAGTAQGDVRFTAFARRSKTGRLRSYEVVDVEQI